ncbi:hypothetical protein ACQPYH_30075 [Kribbella sp. CA-245084]|uniref:hypothetical protein n=1 Tax=Kribbella sp. CA-245084 TaxID=3239940 RepID=UPI003D92B804
MPGRFSFLLRLTASADGQQSPVVNSKTLAWILILCVAVIVLAGVAAVLRHRLSLIKKAPDHASDLRMTRPVIAIILVGGLILLTVWSMGFGNPEGQLQLLLTGAVISLSSAAVAFYFSSSGAADARKDLLTATGGRIIVPNLMNQRVVARTNS